VARLADKGFSEVVLTGIHVASYGKDLQDTTLLDVIRRMDQVENLHRIRLSSLEPTLMTAGFVEALGKSPKICPHFHLSLQSGSETVLKRMNRRYSLDQYREAVARLRAQWPQVAITTDIIVGFPGETEAEFEETCAFVKEMAFAQVHVFNYSAREGTPAAVMAGQVAPEVRQGRLERLLDIVQKQSRTYLEQFVGNRMRVIVEGVPPKGQYAEGLTDNYLRVILEGEPPETGSEQTVTITGVDEDALRAIL
jgi:threonylcarbamoyladenosine tRNA methylthiotransferase MtaB